MGLIKGQAYTFNHFSQKAQQYKLRGVVSGIDKMIPEYYKIRGWDENGQLKAETRSRLGL